LRSLVQVGTLHLDMKPNNVLVRLKGAGALYRRIHCLVRREKRKEEMKGGKKKRSREIEGWKIECVREKRSTGWERG
jgi:hypothetical protein